MVRKKKSKCKAPSPGNLEEHLLARQAIGIQATSICLNDNFEMFQHEPLNPSLYRPIRLLTLYPLDQDGLVNCSISTYELETAPPFHGLSYMWGPAGDEKTIHINENSFRVRTNLWHFLRYLSDRKLHKLGPFQIWADAICIDQHNAVERSHQVGFMNQIYVTAASVIAWLGPKSSSSALFAHGGSDVSSMVRWLASKTHPDHWTSLDDVIKDKKANEQEWKTLERFCTNLYWSRTWIVQEILPAERITIIFEEQEIEWGILSYNFKMFYSLVEILDEEAARLLQDSSASLAFVATSPPAQIAVKRLQARKLNRRGRAMLVAARATGFAPLIKLLEYFRFSQCEIILDRIYALLGLSTDCQEFPVDYNILPQTLFRRLVSYLALDPESNSHESSLMVLASSLYLAPLLLPRMSRSGILYLPASRKFTCVGQIVDASEDSGLPIVEVVDQNFTWKSRESYVDVPAVWTRTAYHSIKLRRLYKAPPESISTAHIDALFRNIGVADWGSIEDIIYAKSFLENDDAQIMLIVLEGQITVAHIWGEVTYKDLVYSTSTSHVAMVLRSGAEGWSIVGMALLCHEVARSAILMSLRKLMRPRPSLLTDRFRWQVVTKAKSVLKGYEASFRVPYTDPRPLSRVQDLASQADNHLPELYDALS